jgi:LacI family transcriptional regulator
MTTIREIAKKAGVSIGTVDRVIHNRGRVSRNAKEKISKIIKECNYRPNVFASHLSLAKNYTFAVLVPEPAQDGRYWELPLKGMQKAAEELKPYKVRVRYIHYDKYSETSFFRAGERLLRMRREIDGVVIAPVLSRAAETFLEKIPPGLPFVFIDSTVPNTRCLSFIGQNPFRSGVLAAKLMDMLAGGGGSVAVTRIVPQDYHIDDRVNGFLAFFDNRPSVRLVTYEADRKSDESAFAHLAPRILKENPDLRGIFIPSAIVHQVAEILKRKQPDRKVHLVGYDLVEANLPYLREGWIDFIISQRPEIQGYQGVYLLYQHLLLKNPVPRTLNLPLDIVTSENLEDYLGTS